MTAKISRDLGTFVVLLWLAGCGGGGGGSDSTSSGSSAANDGSDAGNVSPAPNVLPITVGAGPQGNFSVNVPFVSVTICAPGSTVACQVVDHVLVDTASTGLRIVASVLDASLALPLQKDSKGNGLAECAVFAYGYSWGAVRLADVQLAGAKAASIPIEVIADPSFPLTPASCSKLGAAAANTVASLGANAILGVGPLAQDCGSACAQSAIPGAYYGCSTTGCSPVALSLAQQVQNPVAKLPSDNNGVVIDLPAVPASGAASVAGALILGIGTQSNNSLGSARIFDLNSGGNLVTIYNGRTVTAFFDSGSNALFFLDSTIPVCPAASTAPGFYCPVATRNLTATVQATSNGNVQSINFVVDNAASLISSAPGSSAFGSLAAPFGSGAIFDWGLPFFYGRRVFTAIEQQNTPAGVGPYVAF